MRDAVKCLGDDGVSESWIKVMKMVVSVVLMVAMMVALLAWMQMIDWVVASD